jgi:UDP:flavonoid glycosyltransferase YjiC (YdhE family)
MKIGFMSPFVPGRLNPMTTLARQLQSRNHLSALLDEVLHDSAHCSNAGKLKQAIAKTNRLSRAAELVEQRFGLTRSSQKQ